MTKKIILGILVFGILITGFTYPVRQAHAILGVADITINPEGVLGWIYDVGSKIGEIALKGALESLKKRLLDQFVDGVISYIQGNGSPKFVNDFGGFLEDAGQVAVGDVVREIGLGELCTGIDPLRFQIRTQTPVFSQAVSCTLDDVVGNIEEFGNNFLAGGWVGYQELLKPQNNKFGVELLFENEVQRRSAEKQQAAQQEVTAGSGFISVKQCLEWRAQGTNDGGKIVSRTFPYNDPSFIEPYPDPSSPPPILVTGINDVEWSCSEEKITTPGNALAGGLERALYSDLDYIVNSEELTTYIGAIFDAAFNRLVAEGVRGFQNIQLSGNTEETDCDDPRLNTRAQEACRNYIL